MNAPTSEYLEVDPAELLIGSNFRFDPRIDKAFLASIEEHGVLQPIIGYRDTEGRIVVRYGGRRTVAAIQVGRTSVPVAVGTIPEDVDRRWVAAQATPKLTGCRTGVDVLGPRRIQGVALLDRTPGRVGYRGFLASPTTSFTA
jgi:hypothetical protein